MIKQPSKNFQLSESLYAKFCDHKSCDFLSCVHTSEYSVYKDVFHKFTEQTDEHASIPIIL